ncbi:extracellular solute-binding protein [Streptomyces rubiginosohelvolus]|uniref:extracellular solute-binding protein n=1 Tax=Streptomyces rubiginosohelvolus TaxID=67362 RepID=UPI0036D88CF3
MPLRARLRQDYPLLIMVAPAIVLLLLFVYVPLIGNVIAFMDYQPFISIQDSPWVGLANFQALFADPAFWNAVANTLEITLLQLVLFFPVPIALALLVHSLVRPWLRALTQSTYSPADTYANKLATVMARGKVPDLVVFPAAPVPARFPQLLDSLFTDLTEHLSGDAVTKYPNLANRPSNNWQACRVNGKIYGVPVSSSPFNMVLMTRPDLIERFGGDTAKIADKDDFLSLCTELTSRRANRYALGGATDASGVNLATDFVNGMFGVPHRWSHEGQKLTSMYETDQWLEALTYTKKLWDAGVFHPDSPSMQRAQAKTYYQNGTVLMYEDGIKSLSDSSIPKGIVVDAMAPIGAEGGRGISYQSPSMASFTAIRKSDKGRVEELLRVLDYLAAPYASEEWRNVNWGEEDVHFTTEPDNSLVPTDKGLAERAPSCLYALVNGPSALAVKKPAPTKDTLTRMHTYQEETDPTLLADPTVGFYSPTAASAGSATLTVVGAGTDYVLGRKSLDDVKAAVATWKSRVGDKMRSEYLQSLDG